MKQVNKLTRRPTEYMGVVFKSKAEAQTALMLDSRDHYIDGVISRTILYEPEMLKLQDGYVPDFLIHDVVGGKDTCFNNSNQLTVIEYKPSSCTETYKMELHERFSKIASSDLVNAFLSAPGSRCLFVLLEGSFYGGSRKTWTWTGSDPSCKDPECIGHPFDDGLAELWPCDEDWQEVKASVLSYRFDLVQLRICVVNSKQKTVRPIKYRLPQTQSICITDVQRLKERFIQTAANEVSEDKKELLRRLYNFRMIQMGHPSEIIPTPN